MDDILQRMLAVEEKAAELVRRAEADAADILERGRLEAAAAETAAQTRLRTEAETLVSERVEQATAKREKALAHADQELSAGKVYVFGRNLRPVYFDHPASYLLLASGISQSIVSIF